MIDQGDPEALKDVIDPKHVRGFVRTLESKIQKNMELRFQFAEDPERFLDSEVELDDEIQRAKEIPLNNESMQIFLKSDGITHLVQLLIHPNVDLVADVLIVLVDMTDPELLSDLHKDSDEDFDVYIFLEHIMKKQVFVYISDILDRSFATQQTNSEDFDCVTHCLNIIEHLLEIDAALITVKLRENTVVVPLLMKCILHKEAMTLNKVYAVELLVTMFQASSSIVMWAAHAQNSSVQPPQSSISDSCSGDKKILFRGLDGVKNLVNALAMYRKQESRDGQEEEFVANCFQALEFLLTVDAAKDRFLDYQGLQLMVRMMKEKVGSVQWALRLTSIAIENKPAACESFIQLRGLGSLMTYFMGDLSVKSATIRRTMSRYSVSILRSVLELSSSSNQMRVYYKFIENKAEKLHRFFYIMNQCNKELMTSADAVATEVQAMKGASLDTDEDEMLFMKKMDLGLDLMLDCIKVLLLITMSGNSVLVRLTVGLQIMNNISPIECVAFHLEDYYSHIYLEMEDDKHLKKKVDSWRGYLEQYLRTVDGLVGTSYLDTYINARPDKNAELEDIPDI